MQRLESSSNPPSETGVNGSTLLAPPPSVDFWGAEELAATLDSVGTGIWALDLEGRCVFINQAACQALGYRREECLGKRIQCRIHAGHGLPDLPAPACPGRVPGHRNRARGLPESRGPARRTDLGGIPTGHGIELPLHPAENANEWSRIWTGRAGPPRFF